MHLFFSTKSSTVIQSEHHSNSAANPKIRRNLVAFSHSIMCNLHGTLETASIYSNPRICIYFFSTKLSTVIQSEHHSNSAANPKIRCKMCTEFPSMQSICFAFPITSDSEGQSWSKKEIFEPKSQAFVDVANFTHIGSHCLFCELCWILLFSCNHFNSKWCTFSLVAFFLYKYWFQILLTPCFTALSSFKPKRENILKKDFEVYFVLKCILFCSDLVEYKIYQCLTEWPGDPLCAP